MCTRVRAADRLWLIVVYLIGASPWSATMRAQHPIVDTTVHRPPAALDTSYIEADTVAFPITASLSLSQAIERALGVSPIVARTRANVTAPGDQ